MCEMEFNNLGGVSFKKVRDVWLWYQLPLLNYQIADLESFYFRLIIKVLIYCRYVTVRSDANMLLLELLRVHV